MSPGGVSGLRLAAVEDGALERFRAEGTPLPASLILQCSSHVARYVDLEPLHTLLGLAVEAGQPLRDDLWSEVRAPSVHAPDEVVTLASALGDAWREAEQTPVACDDFFIGEIQRVVRLFAHAAEQRQAVVTAILPVLGGPGGPEIVVFKPHHDE
jgi:hypothetical protein